MVLTKETELMVLTRGTDVSDATKMYRTAGENMNMFGLEMQFTLTYPRDHIRYGENPHQAAAVYAGDSLVDFTVVRSAKGGMSVTNWMDASRGFRLLSYFAAPSVAVMKHVIPSGFATQHGDNTLDQIYVNARDADARSAFGSVVVLNRAVDKATAEALASTFVEVVVASEYETGVLDLLEKKKDLRVVSYNALEDIPRFVGDNTRGLIEIHTLPTGQVIAQQPYLTRIRGASNLITDPMIIKGDQRYVVHRDPSPSEMNDLLTAWYVNIGTRSNGIVLVKDGVTLAVGSGQQERVGAVEQAITKVLQKACDRKRVELGESAGVLRTAGASWDEMRSFLGYNPLQNAVVSSDAFFPFPDSVALLGSEGVKAIVQPGGSIRDHEIIQEVNRRGMAMAYTLERCFGHF